MSMMASRLPTPSPSPPLPPGMPIASSATLPGGINVATRTQHTELNRLLIHRLPLALPPHASTPLLFSQGIVPFARIFFLFESEWDVLARQFHLNPTAYSGHDYELRRWLATLRPQGLARSHRLKHDLKHLRQIGGSSVYKTPGLGDGWVEEMRNLIRTNPHVLVAFAWVFYMAVFSGGRWIRQQLANSGSEFWTRQDSTLPVGKAKPPAVHAFPGITFLSFDGEQDGEDLKALFKSRLADAEWLLDDQERQDVIDTAKRLFSRSIGLVNELDQLVYRRKILSWIWPILWATAILATLLCALGAPSRYLRFLF